ncbi:MAG: glycosyltransferase family 4 protein, partial [Flavobacteriales bacterium]|nr:glycosyltransferase family 4 protein [Flavobacteriales bacterium]
IFDRKPDPKFIFAKNIKPIVLFPQARHPFLYYLFFEFSLKRFLKNLNPDLFVGTDGITPLNTKTKTLSVIHDLNFEHYPEQLPKNYRKYYCNNFPKFANQSTRIATVSEFSKKDIIKTYNISPDKIDVVYNGANENFRPINEDIITEIKNRFTEGKNYFLFVGTLHPRKNLIRLFQAFDAFKKQTNSNFKLLIVGKKMWWTDEIESIYNSLQHKSDILFAGRVAEQDLYDITASAYALTYVPIFEGFGIPLVESMSCGVPVITSNVTSMPEVVEDSGLLVDPFSVDDISIAMIQIVEKPELRNTLAEKSLIQAKKFSWNKTASLLWESIQKTLNA